MAEQHDEPESSSGPDKPDPEAQADPQIEGEGLKTSGLIPASEATLARPKKKKKRALAVEAVEPPRDRNRRLREEAAGRRAMKPAASRPAPRALEAGEIVDDALARSSQAAGEWLKKNFNLVQWAIVAGLVAWVGYAIYGYRAGRAAEKASALLTAAIRAEDARIGSDDSKPDPQTGIVDTRATYASTEERLRAAEKKYRAITDGSSPRTATTLARLGLASVLYDQGKYADAKASYQLVKDSKLADQDAAVKGRALEGVAMSLEAAGDTAGAQKAFGELSNLDQLGFNALGAYHQARLALAAGDTEKAKELLKDAQKRLDSASSVEGKKGLGPSGYLAQSIRDLRARVDPSAVSASSNALTADQLQELQEQLGSPGGEGKGMSNAKLQELLKQISKSSTKTPSAPSPPASAP